MSSIRYGMPYQGSKNTIAEWVLQNLPSSHTLYDLFGGGGAITHCALLSGKYRNVVYNELQMPIADLFKRAINGDLKDEKRWISREEFNNNTTDGYISNVWSFANGGKNYLYAKEREPWKKAFHYAVMFEDYSLFKEMGIDIVLTGFDSSSRRLELRQIINKNKEEFKEKYIEWYSKKVLNIENSTFERLREQTLKDKQAEEERLRNLLINALKNSNYTQSELKKLTNTKGMVGHWFGTSQWQFPSEEHYNILKQYLDLPDSYHEVIKWYCLISGKVRGDLNSSFANIHDFDSLEQLENVQHLERLQNLESLQYLQNAYIYQTALMKKYLYMTMIA